ncbi:UNVERIFIED_CONTAM: hypothetical protein Slati_3442000 [Sesamum latifolium]|uniref:Reverse transcriptase n=1 Tax=Sesamum latifolium TaxID=2727402 RepID=A0AAW2UJH0_9LAMI
MEVGMGRFTYPKGGLGFRRLKEYNRVMLAKLAWRVAMKPNNTLHQVLRQRYFPNATFFKAKLGGSLSFTWRSLLRTKDLLIAGIRWRIWDGMSVSIVGVPWLPRPHTFELIFPPCLLSGDTKVSTLLNDGA